MPRYSRVFRRFLVSYLIILIIPSIAGYMSYQTAINVTESVSIENGVTQLQKSKELLERRMAEVEGFTRQLAINQDLSILMNENSSGDQSNVYGIWKMMKDVLTFGQTNDFLKNFFVYLSNYDVVLTPGSAYFRPEHYYESYHYLDMPLDEWKSSVLERTHRSEIMALRPYMDNKTETSVVTYMQSLPLDSFNGSSPAVAVVMIDQKMITDPLSGLTDRYGGWIHIADAEGHTVGLRGAEESQVASLATGKNFDEEKLSQFYEDDLVITIKSDTTGWVYRAGIPREALMESANQIKFITWIVTGIALFVGLIVGLLLSYRNSAPIIRMLGVMKEQFGPGQDDPALRNEFDFLHGNIAQMLTQHKRLESELHRQAPLVRDAFFKRLLAGEFQTRDEIIAAAVQSNAGLTGDVGYVGILQVNGYPLLDNVEVLNELNAARLILKQALIDSGSSVRMTDTSSDKIVFLFAFHDLEVATDIGKEEVTKTLERVSRLAFEEFRISVTVVLGGLFQTITEVSQSYEQAKGTLDVAVHHNRKEMTWFEDIRQESATYHYPLELELRLIGTVRAGEFEEARRILQSIVSQNTETRELSYEMKQQLAVEMKGTFLKLLDQKVFMEAECFEELKNRIIGIQATDPLETIQEELAGVMEALCEVVRSRKNDGHLRTIEQIKTYVHSSYADSALTLYRVAEQVERPEKYISQLFKEVTGENLSDYLENVRMEQASILLKQDALTVDEIAARVGYNSSHSFRRAFKRVTGVSPSVFRQSALDG
ncbi:helix-turn-helix domain-containing protein [Paenibacillus sp. LHD-117]|uniref:helix-turn-helix domain-containing protein n=1 Tax=Paenibacillus sp. LHD-117 TaxID=3071412 RepID=UPI0027DF1DF8|nr:helix-turn-helix domain-containing protein [Paenibacillus sp. LHD-117]MDQ6421470.1 helix-turn-helix domain-containing protein [Paenibacillus sp. LHD-117]